MIKLDQLTDHQEIFEAHPELFHYTDRNGIAGILASQSLWATHFRYLNDTTEIQLMRHTLADRLFPIIKKEILSEYRNAGINKRKRMAKQGGVNRIARAEASNLGDIYYRVAFEDTESGPALGTPYITSFCAHTSDGGYEQENGLLSQWRGYGREGGYAIVFDTKKLAEMYMAEADKYYYSFLQLGDVVYGDDGDAFDEEFGPKIKKIIARLQQFTETGEFGSSGNYVDILSMFTRLKHRGFREEREVRAVAFPITREIEDHNKRLVPNYVSPNKPMKEMKYRSDGAPYIEMLNLDKKARLPIKRIIVGPQTDQAQAEQEIRRIMGKRRIKINRSETPISWSKD